MLEKVQDFLRDKLCNFDSQGGGQNRQAQTVKGSITEPVEGKQPMVSCVMLNKGKHIVEVVSKLFINHLDKQFLDKQNRLFLLVESLLMQKYR
ncbi:hypothetical protein YC2023_071338 [Brassica napus]